VLEAPALGGIGFTIPDRGESRLGRIPARPARSSQSAHLLFANTADGLHAPPIMQPAPVVLGVVRVCETRKPEGSTRARAAVIAGSPDLTGVDDAHTEQLAVVLVRKRQELR